MVSPALDRGGRIKDPVLADYSGRRGLGRAAFLVVPPPDPTDPAGRTATRSSLSWRRSMCTPISFSTAVLAGPPSQRARALSRRPSAWLHDGDNELLIRLTSGLESVRDTDLAELDSPSRPKLVRLPRNGATSGRCVRAQAEYVYAGTGPRIGTCGIVKPVWLGVPSIAGDPGRFGRNTRRFGMENGQLRSRPCIS